MMNPEEATKTLEKHRVKDWEARRLATVTDLSRSIRPIAWQLLGYDKNGKKPNSYDWQAINKAHWETVQQLEGLSDSDRQAIFACLFPKIAPQIEAAWQLQKQFPYQLGGHRRAFRTPQSPTLTLSRRSSWLSAIFSVTTGYEEDVVWLAQWAAYLTRYGSSQALGVLFAATIDIGTEVGDQVFDILVASAKGEHDIGAMGRHVTQGLLSASQPEGWALIEQLLIAAQRQEGLRQVILETVDEAHPEAFRRMVRLIREHNLVRFSSVVRAIDVWLGLQWEAANTRVVQQILEQLDDLLHDPVQRLAALSGDDPQAIYLALCVSGFEDAQTAATQAKPLLVHDKLEHRFVATYFLSQLNLAESENALLPKLDDDDLRVATVAFEAVQPSYYSQISGPPTLFEQIEAAIPRFPAKKKTLEPLVWPWFTLTADRQMLANALPGALEQRPYSRLFPYLNLMDTRTRAYVVREFIATDKKPWDTQTREVLLKLMGDRGQYVRQVAIETATKMRLEADDAQQLEGYLTRKAGDLRRGILGILLAQGDKAVLASAERLLVAKHQLQRQAGLELLRQLKEKKRQIKRVEKLARTYADERKQLSASEQTLLEAIDDRQPEPATLDDGLGLFDPAQRTPVIAPKAQTGLFKKQLFSKSSAAAACLRSLDDLVHTHRETPITFQDGRGGTHEELLGNLQWGFPPPDPEKPIAEDIDRLPLAEVWQSWWAERPAKLRDQDGLEIFRALIAFEAGGYLPHYLFDFGPSPTWLKKAEELLYGKINLKKVRYGSLINRILWWLVRLSPPQQAADFLLDAVEHNFYLLHRKKWFVQLKDSALHSFLGWLKLARQHRQICLIEWEDTHHVRLWQLLRWFDEFKWATRPYRADIDEIMRAYHAGGATEADIFHHLIGPRKEDRRYVWARGDFGDLRELSGRKRRKHRVKFADDPKLQQCVAQCRQRIVEIELARGDLPTAASQPALSLRYAGGLETLLQLLNAFGKETFERGWIHGKLSKKAIFSHLIRSTFPAESNTPESFAEQIKAYDIKPNRLVETAIYAPQWASHIEVTLDWPEFTEAVWWFHAHTKDNQWRIDQDIREVWQAQTNERTPLSGQDLLDGAVDVAWFGRVYAALGVERWAELDQAAKYASGGGGHKRAQLFAEAMLGQIEEANLVQRITQKRHQDSIRALGLLPLPLNGSRDDVILQRYQTIQEFVRGSRKFGSQRQASEKLAAKIGLENLARTAGYPDPLRLEWAMEARAVADLAAGPVSATQGEVTVTLAIDEWGEPQLTIIKKERPLKAVPAKLKKQSDIATLLNRKREIKKQASRMRQSLEQAMCRGDVFSGTELQQLLTHPVLKPMLTQLVFIGDSIMGYPDDDGQHLTSLKGQCNPLAPNVALRLAHPHDLLLTNEWHIWQAECFSHEYIQPFKQVFRELYVPTAAETAQATASHRYAGHQVNPRQTLALLGQRGWVSHPEEGVRRTFHDEGVAAWLSFQNGYFTPAEVEGLTLEGIHFSRRGEWKPLPFGQVPPRLFSEVMRDLDLVVSVAHQGGVDPEASASTVEMRTALIRETCAMLGLDNVRLKNNHTLIEGKLNNYSVHLGSGVVHQRPGGYLCLVPVHSQRRGRIFLPFADDDPKTAEVISKVLLLAEDNNIKDPSILEQILPRA